MPSALSPLVVDLSHHNKVTSWAKVYAAGVRGVIYKATQGAGVVDKTYLASREQARANGLLWGAYHFGTDDDVEAQVDNFLKRVGWGGGTVENTLLALDWEPEPGGHTMSIEQAQHFLALVAGRTGQCPVLYGGQLLKDTALVGPRGDPFLCEHRLWLSHYNVKPKLPPGFKRYFLWQYTDGEVGPQPRTLDGVTGSVDLNVFDGRDLAAEWVDRLATQVVEMPVPAPQEVAETVSAPPSSQDTLAPPPAPGRLRKAGRAVTETNASHSVWAILNAKWAVGIGGIYGLFAWAWDRLFDLLDVLPAITQDVGGNIDQVKQISTFLRLSPEQCLAIGAAIAVPLLILAIVRHVHDKQQVKP